MALTESDGEVAPGSAAIGLVADTPPARAGGDQDSRRTGPMDADQGFAPIELPIPVVVNKQDIALVPCG